MPIAIWSGGRAQAEPAPIFFDQVCATMHHYPTLPAVSRMMDNYSVVLFTRQNAWDTIVNGMAAKCPEHADLLRLYATVYGDG